MQDKHQGISYKFCLFNKLLHLENWALYGRLVWVSFKNDYVYIINPTKNDSMAWFQRDPLNKHITKNANAQERIVSAKFHVNKLSVPMNAWLTNRRSGQMWSCHWPQGQGHRRLTSEHLKVIIHDDLVYPQREKKWKLHFIFYAWLSKTISLMWISLDFGTMPSLLCTSPRLHLHWTRDATWPWPQNTTHFWFTLSYLYTGQAA